MRTLFALAAATLVALPFQEKQEERKPVLPEVGKPAPAFRLNDQTGKAVAVGGEADDWRVVAFFPKAATPG